MHIVTRWVLHQYTTAYTSTSLVPTSHTSTVPAAYEPVTFLYYSDDALLSSCHSRARTRDPVAHRLATESLLRPSFLRSSCADRRFFLRPAAEPMTYSGRPPWPRPHRRPSSAVQPRYASSTLTNMSDILYRITI